jgi:hypothetical protein
MWADRLERWGEYLVIGLVLLILTVPVTAAVLIVELHRWIEERTNRHGTG